MAQWSVGFGRSVVTPPLGVPLAGYGNKPQRTAGSVLDELYARVLLLDDGKNRAALVALDLISVSAGLTAVFRAAVEKAAGVPAASVMVTCSHTHSSPAGAYFRRWGAIDPQYISTLEPKVTEAAQAAAASLRPAALGLGRTEVRGVAKNRVRPDGPVDHALSLAAFREPGGALRGVAAHFSCHPVMMPANDRSLSADFPGRLVRDLERDFPGAFGVFFQGTLGDINPEGAHKGQDFIHDHGSRLAEGARRALKELSWEESGEIACARVDCELPLDLADARREAEDYLYRGILRKGHAGLAANGFLREWAVETLGLLAARPPETLRCEVQAIRAGRWAVVGLPAEIYTLIGEAVREASPFPHTWVAGFANGVVGYVADPRDYVEETYASAMTPKIYGYLPFKPEAWRVLADAGLAALKKL